MLTKWLVNKIINSKDFNDIFNYKLDTLVIDYFNSIKFQTGFKNDEFVQKIIETIDFDTIITTNYNNEVTDAINQEVKQIDVEQLTKDQIEESVDRIDIDDKIQDIIRNLLKESIRHM